MPTFETWERAILEKFAYEAQKRLDEQQEQVEQLQADLKTAIEAYRKLMI